MNAKLAKRLQRFSPRNYFLWHEARAVAPMVIATIDEVGFYDIRRRARDLSPRLMDLKYFHLESAVSLAMYKAFRLGLQEERRKDMLDLGTGFGFFPYVCEFFGNNTEALDLPGHGLYDEITNFLRIKKTHHVITPFQPLPDLGKKFDYVTAFLTAFNRPGLATEWKAAEWEFFLNDMRTRILKPNGVLHVELNYSHRNKEFLERSAKAFLKQAGCELRAGQFTFRT